MNSSLQYYLFYCSIVLLYGIGLNHATAAAKKPSLWLLHFTKAIITVPVTTVLSWLFIKVILTPCRLSELYPLVCILIFIAVSVFSEIFIRITTGKSTAEFTVSFLSVLLSINEGSSLFFAFIISLFCVLSFYLLLPFIYALNKRIEVTGAISDFKKNILILLSLAAVMIILDGWNVSWLSTGVLK
jgi:Na+-translocating ferredoxin:NAD+ oxidoreductase RnfA subunit